MTFDQFKHKFTLETKNPGMMPAVQRCNSFVCFTFRCKFRHWKRDGGQICQPGGSACADWTQHGRTAGHWAAVPAAQWGKGDETLAAEDDDDDNDDAVLYSAVTSSYCSMVGVLGRVIALM